MGKAKRGRPVGRAVANKNKLDDGAADRAVDETFVVKHKSPSNSPEISLPAHLPTKTVPSNIFADSPEKHESDSGLDDYLKHNSSVSEDESTVVKKASPNKHQLDRDEEELDDEVEEEEEPEDEEQEEEEQEEEELDEEEEDEDEDEIPLKRTLREKKIPKANTTTVVKTKPHRDEDSDISDESEEEVFVSEIDLRAKTSKQSGPSNSGPKTSKANLTKVMKAKGRDNKASEKKPITKKGKEAITVKKRELMLDIILEGLSKLDERKGVSMPTLRKYVMDNDVASNKSWEKLRSKVRLAIESGIEEELIIRPKGSESVSGLTGFFKINKKKYNTKPVEKAEEKNSKTLKSLAVAAEKLKTTKTTKESKTQGKKSAPKSPIAAKTTQKSKSSKTSTRELVKQTETKAKAKKKPVPKSKHRRSISDDEIVIPPKKGKKGMAKSSSLEHLAPAPKKYKAKK